ncbi:hypothetical protein E3N88_45753 [Mikania micrantha]|uniref:No apical meristem-associated C-terminal domain-containing protein n=1 Tax=Mikania micrantha TaxID=192012 RepID=A0A5N6L897_9ASTR|nr:hypothetical protein E3N88_45753 [Mikania micrantha]
MYNERSIPKGCLLCDGLLSARVWLKKQSLKVMVAMIDKMPDENETHSLDFRPDHVTESEISRPCMKTEKSRRAANHEDPNSEEDEVSIDEDEAMSNTTPSLETMKQRILSQSAIDPSSPYFIVLPSAAPLAALVLKGLKPNQKVKRTIVFVQLAFCTKTRMKPIAQVYICGPSGIPSVVLSAVEHVVGWRLGLTLSPTRKGKRSAASSSSHDELIQQMAEFNSFNKEESQQRFRHREEKLRVLQEEKDARVALMRRQQHALDEQQKAVDLEFMMKDHTIYQEPMLQLILDRKREIAARWG